LKDTAVGVGAVLGVSLVLAGLLSAGLGLAGAPLRAFVLVVAAEVGAKSATALLVCVGSAPHEGLGSALVGEATERAFMPVLAFSLPAVVLPVFIPGSSRSLAVSLAPLLALVAALLTGLLVLRWANENLGGVNGDVLGATTEFSRVVALHVGVIAWTRF
jgi:adenosylcobinamide-GDP ribazoletransferase